MSAHLGPLVWLLIFVLAGLVMARDIRRRPGSDYFSPLSTGLVPALFFCTMFFLNLQRSDFPEMAQFKASFQEQVAQKLAESATEMGRSQDMTLAMAREVGSWLIRLLPGMACLFFMAILGAMALGLRYWLVRKKAARLPGPLSRWKAPFFMSWLVTLPLFVLLLNNTGWLGEVDAWAFDLALNTLLVSLAVYLFQGLLVFIERLWRLGMPKPLAAILMALPLAFLANPIGLGFCLVVTMSGLLDTWFDFRKIDKIGRDDKRSRS